MRYVFEHVDTVSISHASHVVSIVVIRNEAHNNNNKTQSEWEKRYANLTYRHDFVLTAIMLQ